MTLIAPSNVLNTYLPLDDLKLRMGISSTTNDFVLWSVLHAVSRAVDRYCNRTFYAFDATRRFDVEDKSSVSLPDLISIVEVLEDRDGDRVFETTRGVNAYSLYPLNVSPGSGAGRPFSEIRSDVSDVAEPFALGRSRLKIYGRWGYRFHVVSTTSSISVSGGISSIVTSIPVDTAADLKAGQTLLIEDEQMFIREISGTTLTVARAVNGSQASTHPDATGMSLVVPPEEVSQAVALLAARYWKSKDATSNSFAGISGFGSITVDSGLDGPVELLLAPLRKLPVGVGV